MYNKSTFPTKKLRNSGTVFFFFFHILICHRRRRNLCPSECARPCARIRPVRCLRLIQTSGPTRCWAPDAHRILPSVRERGKLKDITTYKSSELFNLFLRLARTDLRIMRGIQCYSWLILKKAPPRERKPHQQKYFHETLNMLALWGQFLLVVTVAMYM